MQSTSARNSRFFGLALLVVCSGCWQPPRPTAQQTQRGMIWMFPGVEGGPWALSHAYRALRDAGVDADIRVHDWERHDPLGNLTDHQRNCDDADQIAIQIAGYARDMPHSPIDLVGYSGGGGLAIMVAEALPEDIRLRHIILLQAAVSPDYDLSTVLRHLDGKLVNFCSPLDWFVLGLGTRTFGTMDRQNVESCGKVGFDIARAVPDAALRDRVEQRRWSAAMLECGHYGGHLPMLMYAWNKKYVAPYLLATEAGEATPSSLGATPATPLPPPVSQTGTS